MIQDKNHSDFKDLAMIGKSPLLFLVLILLSVAGCSSDSALERDYGQSWAYNQAVGIANPDAALVLTPATGMDPSSAKTVMEGYSKSFERKKTEDKPSTFIKVGGGN